ncbi:PR domain zinc finger protein 10-like [Homarus americanus]|uniref:PR domain zinc finger protein 10-like n=2 Tax=Homarus americanus TaxID=6706 RepID=A0A8J5TMF0_HOMAM|nr:PR domain zinc finger protein 10-like [Homarus americanus]
MPHTCSICSKEMPSIDKLKIHMLSHSDRRDFLCPDCGKRFKRKDKLREHSKRMHSTEREARTSKSVAKAPPKFVPKVDPTDYKQFVYKCHTCLLGFKRRGMLVNHLAKRHPSVDLTSVPELNQPILKATRCYYCQYCEKMYRSSSKRKLHILKYHPGAELPPPSTTHNESESGEGPSFSQTVGATTTYPHPCKWCYRQYASRARLLRHQRHQHPDLCTDSASLKDYAADVPESEVNDVDPLLESPAGLSGELALGGQLVADGNLLRNHRLVSLARGEPGTSGTEGTEDDLLTQAMGEITPLAGGEQYVRLIGTGTEGQQVVVGTTQAARPLLVSSDGGQQGATLALVTTDSPDTVTLSLPAGQFISLIPGFSAVSTTSRSITNGAGPVNIHTVDAQEGVGSSGALQGEGVSTMRMSSTLNSSLNDNNEAEAVEQVVLATHQPPSPSSSVWQQALTFASSQT